MTSSLGAQNYSWGPQGSPKRSPRVKNEAWGRLWGGFGEALRGFGKRWEGFGNPLQGFGRLWEGFGRFERERRRREKRRTPIYKKIKLPINRFCGPILDNT